MATIIFSFWDKKFNFRKTPVISAMTSTPQGQSIFQVVQIYKELLTQISEVQFCKKADPQTWSAGEIYHHIFDSSILSLKAIKVISEGQAEQQSTRFIVRLILCVGKLPPGKIKAPGAILNRVKSISKEEAKNLIESFETKLTFTINLFQKSQLVGSVKHPVMGPLNARQWLRFIEIHLKHHLKQLKRTI